ncbi:CLUMA_CG001116, isoform A [Clunio marinus]|uniref:poly(ADP-ribose) glycohydrolase n=1 Tax=Clunio marinus TaxID=568069 RepID=A0A1J1HID5_9DIPT|nr:CLUMA_CG001116, isoform A [Clunio marinus]
MSNDVSHSRHESNLNDIFGNYDKWSYQSPSLHHNRNHVVLFHLPFQEENDLPKPHRGSINWDFNHVRLPCSPESLYTEITNQGKVLKSRWHLIETTLLQPILNSHELEGAIKTYNTRYESIWNFSTLHELFEVHLRSEDVTFFFDQVLPNLIRLALQLPQLIQCPIPLLKQGVNKSISMSQQQAACLLANAFLCTFPRRNTDKRGSEYSNYPTINFNRLYGAHGNHVIEKLKCLCSYFRRILCVEMPRNVITFQRRFLKDHIDWNHSEKKTSTIEYKISSTGKIEDAYGMLQVDFANRFVGGGVLNQGCVQEEIRFLINPEMIVAKLFTESLLDDEALIMIGCEQFNDYTGYASSFKYAGDYSDKTPLDSFRRRKCRVVAIDALPYKDNIEQFKEFSIQRDLHKAYLGFFNDSTENSPVATGLWGCGAFNGHHIRAALIQFLACCENNRNLVFYSFGDDQTKKEVEEIFNLLVERQATVNQVFKTLKNFRNEINSKNSTSLLSFIKNHFEVKTVPESKQTSLFNFVIPKSSKLFAVEENKTLQPSTSNQLNFSKSSSRDKKKFDDIENTFSMFTQQSSKQSQNTKNAQPKSLIDSLDSDFEMRDAC